MVENLNWEDKYCKLKILNDALQKSLQDLIDTNHMLRDVIDAKNVIISDQRVTIDHFNELTERQCKNNKLMLEYIESQSQTLELQNEVIESSVVVRLDDKYR